MCRTRRATPATKTGCQTPAEGGPGEAVRLGAPAPNPTRAGAEVPFELGAAGPARLDVFDALGRRVATLADGPHAAGRHRAAWAPGRLAAGVYVVRLEAAGTVRTRTLTVAR